MTRYPARLFRSTIRIHWFCANVLLAAAVLLLARTEASAQANVLDRRISVQISNISLVAALDRLEPMAGISFAYTAKSINKNRRVNITAVNLPFSDVLKLLLYEDGARFTAVGSQIIIYQADSQYSYDSDIPVRDTIWTQVINTVNVADTQRVVIADTLRYYDTIEVRTVIKKKESLTRKKKAALLQADLIMGYANIPLHSRAEDAFSFGNCQRIMSGAVLTSGLNTEHWELRTGAGIMLARQSLRASSQSITPWETTDSALQYRLVYDSSYLAIPGVDTVWVVDKVLDQYYTYTHKQGADTIRRATDARQQLKYLRIPVIVSYKYPLGRTFSFIAHLSFATDILLGSNATVPIISTAGSTLAELSSAPVCVSAGLSAGIDFQISRTWFAGIAPWYEMSMLPLFTSAQYQRAPVHNFGLALSLKKYF